MFAVKRLLLMLVSILGLTSCADPKMIVEANGAATVDSIAVTVVLPPLNRQSAMGPCLEKSGYFSDEFRAQMQARAEATIRHNLREGSLKIVALESAADSQALPSASHYVRVVAFEAKSNQQCINPLIDARLSLIERSSGREVASGMINFALVSSVNDTGDLLGLILLKKIRGTGVRMSATRARIETPEGKTGWSMIAGVGLI